MNFYMSRNMVKPKEKNIWNSPFFETSKLVLCFLSLCRALGCRKKIKEGQIRFSYQKRALIF